MESMGLEMFWELRVELIPKERFLKSLYFEKLRAFF